jgi:hypothetical protein
MGSDDPEMIETTQRLQHAGGAVAHPQQGAIDPGKLDTTGPVADPFPMKRIITIVILAAAIAALSASVVLAAPPAGATGHGESVSAVARAVGYVSGRARGEAVSALAKAHGAVVSAAAQAQGEAAAAAGKAKGQAAAAAGKANGAAASEPGRLKGAAAAAAGQAHQP